ncbi:MAG: DUF317 domain-containing protein [Streptomycetaceae bacterium]|nr:DUF317 domain-containing protein [Streptomycetaceae bacterium]
MTFPDDAPWYLDEQEAACVVTELLDRPDWTVDDDSAPATYTSSGGHLQVRLDGGGWLYEARDAADADPLWHAYFAPAVPAEAIRAFTAALLTSP